MADDAKKKIALGPKLAVPISSAVRAGDYIYVSGQIGFNDKGEVVSGGIEAETRATLKWIEKIVTEAGATMADIVKTTVFLDDPRDFGRFNKVYAEFFPTDPPARSTIRAQLVLDAKIEIEAVVYKPL